MAQTIVELIIKDLDNECKSRGMFVNWDMYLAKEKEQIEKAFNEGMLNSVDYFGNGVDEAEQYYNETYKK
jgi:hypothetical protein